MCRWPANRRVRFVRCGGLSRAEYSAYHISRAMAIMALAMGIGVAQIFFDPVFEEESYQSAGDRAGNQIPEQALILQNHLFAGALGIVKAEAAEGELNPLAEEIEQDGDQGAEVQRYVEREAGIGPVQQVRN